MHAGREAWHTHCAPCEVCQSSCVPRKHVQCEGCCSASAFMVSAQTCVHKGCIRGCAFVSLARSCKYSASRLTRKMAAWCAPEGRQSVGGPVLWWLVHVMSRGLRPRALRAAFLPTFQVPSLRSLTLPGPRPRRHMMKCRRKRLLRVVYTHVHFSSNYHSSSSVDLNSRGWHAHMRRPTSCDQNIPGIDEFALRSVDIDWCLPMHSTITTHRCYTRQSRHPLEN